MSSVSISPSSLGSVKISSSVSSRSPNACCWCDDTADMVIVTISAGGLSLCCNDPNLSSNFMISHARNLDGTIQPCVWSGDFPSSEPCRSLGDPYGYHFYTWTIYFQICPVSRTNGWIAGATLSESAVTPMIEGSGLGPEDCMDFNVGADSYGGLCTGTISVASV